MRPRDDDIGAQRLRPKDVRILCARKPDLSFHAQAVGLQHRYEELLSVLLERLAGQLAVSGVERLAGVLDKGPTVRGRVARRSELG